ncbi:hypothetical protein K3495_g5027 [Podosphaera aphanis]|nr:hypothetical protein K3495_g5027 [Podosphaera aphanis]
MSNKRKFDDTAGIQHVHESRKQIVYGKDGTKKPKKRRILEPPTYKKQASGSSVNAIKKRIRDVTRRLARPDISSADLRNEDERALAVYQQELATAQAEKIRQKMIKKYHMVRFFERQKASRQLKKFRKRLSTAESSEEVKLLETQIHEAEVDLNYTMFHPLCETYISLFPPKNSTCEELDSHSNTQNLKPPIWSEVERAMVDGSLQKLRDRISILPDTPSNTLRTVKKLRQQTEPEVSKTESIPQNRRQRRSQKQEMKKVPRTPLITNDTQEASHNVSDANEDSDGGFFEL